MSKPVDNFWKIRLEEVKSALTANNFDVFIASDKQAAKDMFFEEILPGIDAKTVSYCGSMTFMDY